MSTASRREGRGIRGESEVRERDGKGIGKGRRKDIGRTGQKDGWAEGGTEKGVRTEDESGRPARRGSREEKRGREWRACVSNA